MADPTYIDGLNDALAVLRNQMEGERFRATEAKVVLRVHEAAARLTQEAIWTIKGKLLKGKIKTEEVAGG